MSRFYLSDLSEKDKPWDKRRAETDAVRAVYEQTPLLGHAGRLDKCAQQLIFALADGKFTLETAQFCRVRQCPTCQWRRQLMWKGRFIRVLPDIERDFPNGRWILLTLTLKNCPVTELRETIAHMNRSWKRLTQLKVFPAIGFIRSLEVTRNKKDGSAHPHFHVLLLVRPSYFKGKGYIKKAEWSGIWERCLRVDYNPIVDVRVVKGAIDASKEVLKYQTKPNDLIADPQWLYEFTKQVHKTRAVSVGGVLSKYFSDEEPTEEELIHGEESTVELSPDDPRFIAHWQRTEKRYKGSFRD